MFLVTIAVAILLVVTVLCFLYFRYIYSTTDYLPKMFFKESALNSFVFKKSTIGRRPFRPNLFLDNRHVQTIVGVFRPQTEIRFEREYLQMADKGVVALDWVIHNNGLLKRYAPILVIFPPLHTDYRSVSTLCEYAAKKGFRTLVFNSRGHGKSFITTKRLQSFGDPLDVRQAIIYIRQKHQKSNVVTIAIGSGSTMLFSYLGEYGSSSRLKASAFVSPIYDTSETLSEPKLPLFYAILFLFGLKKILLRHSTSLKDVVDISKALRSWSLAKYIDFVYCALSGMDNLELFLEKNNPMRDVDDISTPVLCINSKDDPVSPNSAIPYDIFQFYPNMLLVATNNGGHCGFLEDLVSPSWADQLAVDYLLSVLEFSSGTKECVT